MSFADQLHLQAYHLVGKDHPNPPEEASLRRAVSTAYYALFHLLIGDAVGNWNREKEIANTFILLQDWRPLADYDSSKIWSRDDVVEALSLGTEAFEKWALIRHEDLAQDYLLSFLLKR
jgi:hypothetical protein